MMYSWGMKRTQIQLDERTFERMRERAFRERISIAEVIRRLLTEQTIEIPHTRPHVTPFSFVGSGRSRGRGAGNIAVRHDEELTDAYGS